MESLPFYILIGVIPVTILVMFIISRIAWTKLATAYPAGSYTGGTRIGIISLAVNFLNYNNAFVLTYNEQGIHLKAIFIVRLFHKPVFIPWKEIKAVNDKKVHFFSYKELFIGSPLIAKLGIRKKTFDKLENTFDYYSRRN